MKPAFSVLIFTVTSGAGYGLLIWMIVLQLLQHFYHGALVNMTELIGGGLLGLVLVTLGLLSSTLHLANPKNAWRAFNRFRTSWLSREGVFALTFYPLMLGYALVLWLNGGAMTPLAVVIGGLAIANALTTDICTGMIYASLKPIRQWHNPLTTPLYILLSLASGCLLLIALVFIVYGEVSSTLSTCFLVTLVISAIVKWLYFIVIGKPAGSTINDATGFTEKKGKSQAQVRLLDVGHSADTFLTNEFGYDAGALKIVKLRRLMALTAFVLPLVIVSLSVQLQLGGLVYLAIASLFTGLFIERWLFFAEARHVVRLYHGDQRT